MCRWIVLLYPTSRLRGIETRHTFQCACVRRPTTNHTPQVKIAPIGDLAVTGLNWDPRDCHTRHEALGLMPAVKHNLFRVHTTACLQFNDSFQRETSSTYLSTPTMYLLVWA